MPYHLFLIYLFFLPFLSVPSPHPPPMCGYCDVFSSSLSDSWSLEFGDGVYQEFVSHYWQQMKAKTPGSKHLLIVLKGDKQWYLLEAVAGSRGLLCLLPHPCCQQDTSKCSFFSACLLFTCLFPSWGFFTGLKWKKEKTLCGLCGGRFCLCK